MRTIPGLLLVASVSFASGARPARADTWLAVSRLVDFDDDERARVSSAWERTVAGRVQELGDARVGTDPHPMPLPDGVTRGRCDERCRVQATGFAGATRIAFLEATKEPTGVHGQVTVERGRSMGVLSTARLPFDEAVPTDAMLRRVFDEALASIAKGADNGPVELQVELDDHPNDASPSRTVVQARQGSVFDRCVLLADTPGGCALRFDAGPVRLELSYGESSWPFREALTVTAPGGHVRVKRPALASHLGDLVVTGLASFGLAAGWALAGGPGGPVVVAVPGVLALVSFALVFSPFGFAGSVARFEPFSQEEAARVRRGLQLPHATATHPDGTGVVRHDVRVRTNDPSITALVEARDERHPCVPATNDPTACVASGVPSGDVSLVLRGSAAPVTHAFTLPPPGLDLRVTRTDGANALAMGLLATAAVLVASGLLLGEVVEPAWEDVVRGAGVSTGLATGFGAAYALSRVGLDEQWTVEVVSPPDHTASGLD